LRFQYKMFIKHLDSASSKHLGADLLEPAAQAQQVNVRLARKISRKHNADHLGVQFLRKVKRKLSTSRDNADTLPGGYLKVTAQPGDVSHQRFWQIFKRQADARR